MLLIAGKPLRVGDSVRQIGDPIPEAQDWKNLRSYVGMGQVLQVPENVPFDNLERTLKARILRLGIEDKLRALGLFGSEATVTDGAEDPPGTEEPEDLPEYYCAACNKSFTSAKGLAMHDRRMHE